MKPIYIHSGMAGAPQYANADGSINGILEACLINGFNSKTSTSASASGGVLTLNFGADPGFESLQTVELAASSVALVNGQHRVVANSNNQVTIAIPGLPDGAVGSSGAGITIKQAGAGWSKPFGNSTVSVFRPPVGNRQYVRCEHLAGLDFRARGYETMTDINTGDGLFPMTEQLGTPVVIGSTGSAVGSQWYFCASDKWFYFFLADRAVNVDLLGYCVGYMFFGDFLSGVAATDPYKTGLISSYCNYFSRVGSETQPSSASLSGDLLSPPWSQGAEANTGFVPYVTLHDSTNVLRGILPNIYKMTPNGLAIVFKKTFENINGIDGRVIAFSTSPYQASKIAIAIDQEVWE